MNALTTAKIDDVPKEVRGELAQFSPTIQILLWQRGIDTKAKLEKFIAPSYEEDLHDPLLLNDIVKATERIKKAIKQQEKIAIFSDYDCDGIPGAVVLHDFFTSIGYENFTNYIPHRHYEGFGLSVSAVEKLAKDGAKLIITIDCGVTDVEAVAKANDLGVDVIITDHHEPPAELPKAVALVNPKLGKYPFPDLCGAAVAFKLAQAMLKVGDYNIIPGQEKWWLDMVGVATIADMVPLVGENRALAFYGLKVLRKSRRPGLQKLLRAAKANQSYLTEDDIGFTIGPRINAASRMDAPEHAFRLLADKDEVEAHARVQVLEKLNNERKGVVANMTKELHHWVAESAELPPVLVFGHTAWRPSLVGLAANKLAEEHCRPVFLWGRDGNEIIKGSCRTGNGVSVVELMRATADIFLEFGGHHGSGGFSVRDTDALVLSERLNQAYLELGEAVNSPVASLNIHATIDLHDIFGQLPRELARLAPFGLGNEKPLFAFRKVAPSRVEMFGKTKEHLKVSFTTSSGEVEAIAFFATPEKFAVKPEVGVEANYIAHIEESYFMGRLQRRLRLVEVLR